MSDDASAIDESARKESPSPAQRWKNNIEIAKVIGFLVSFAGLIDGIVMMAHKKVAARCPNGTTFPVGETDFRCFRHPLGATGFGVAALSVLLGILVFLAAFIANRLVTLQSDLSAADDRHIAGGPAQA